MTSKFKAISSILLATAAMVVAAAPAHAQAAEARKHVDIPAQALSKSLTAFARQTRTEIVFSPELVDAKQAPAISGNLAPNEVLARLLSGSGLHARKAAGGAYVIEYAQVAQLVKASQPVTSTDAPPAAEPAPAAAPEPAGDIVVTGSRVITNGNNSPTPVTVVSTASLLEAQPAGVVQGLNNIPALLGSINSTSNVNSGGFNTLNLRGVGSVRGLVLFNGHRVGPTRSAGQVNVDVVPQILLQRVDVVTGGASAVYGSDAVSGVVNFVTDTKFNGIKAEIQGGVSRYNDDEKAKFGIAYGTPLLDGRGHFEASYEFVNQEGFDRADRPFFTPSYSIQGSIVQPVNGVTSAPGTALNPYILVRDARLAQQTFGGRINNGALSDLDFTQNGILVPFVHGTRTGTSNVELGGAGAQYVNNTASTSQRIHRGFARFDYDVTDNVHAHVDGTYTTFDAGYRLQNPTLNVAIGYNNPFLDTVTVQSPTFTQAQFATLLATQRASATPTSFNFGKISTQLPNYEADVKMKYWMGAVGFDGDIGSFGWSADYFHTDSKERIANLHNINAGRLLAATNAVRVNGQIVCNAAIANPTVYGSCVPLNLFGPTSASQAAMDYIQQVTSSTQHYWADNFVATLKGSPFNLPGGPANFAITGEWRKLHYEVLSDAVPSEIINCTGIQFGCVAAGGTAARTTPYLAGNGANVQERLSPVSDTVKEASFEAALPVLADLPLIKALDISAAARYTDYRTSGTVWTWKLGAVWRVADALTLRVTRSRDIRAPTLNDLFQPVSQAPRQYSDQHTGGTTGSVNTQTQGNPNLTPEKADTWTVGGVLKPDFIPGLSLTVDYYRINIKNAIVNVDAFQPGTQSTCELSGGTSPVCDLYIRPLPFSNISPLNFPTLLLGQSLNVASLKTYGVDFEANYVREIAGRNLTLRALVNWQPHLIYNNGPAGIVDIGGAADGIGGLPAIPKIKVVASAAYNFTDALRVLVQERWRSKYRQNGTASLIFVTGDVPTIGYTDINVTYKFTKSASFFVNVQNLFDTAPRPYAPSGGSVQPNYLGGFAQGDDIEGRYYTAGMRFRF